MQQNSAPVMTQTELNLLHKLVKLATIFPRDASYYKAGVCLDWAVMAL